MMGTVHDVRGASGRGVLWIRACNRQKMPAAAGFLCGSPDLFSRQHVMHQRFQFGVRRGDFDRMPFALLERPDQLGFGFLIALVLGGHVLERRAHLFLVSKEAASVFDLFC
jgi:hypothetical protein